jgi:hypothetical protein
VRLRILICAFALSGGWTSFGSAAAVNLGAGAVRFVPASAELLAMCRATARSVGYPVPCPTRVPAGLVGVGGSSRCVLEIIGAGCPTTPPCWCGWVVGAGVSGTHDLALLASPRPIAGYARLVNGPAWYPAARTRPLGWIVVNGRRMREVWVPAASNDGSSFSDHLALIWSGVGHTYAIGFQNVDGMAETLRLDRILAGGIRMISPPSAIARDGVAVRAPGDWGAVAPADEVGVVDPVTVLVAGSPGVRALARPECQIAAYDVPADGAVVVVVRWRTVTSGGGRPPAGRAPLRKLTRVTRPSFECFTGRGAVAQLALGGHSYQVNVMVGDRATTHRVGQALAVARSFDLRRRRTR